jgi:hypothetical protein
MTRASDDLYRRLVPELLGREWQSDDGAPEGELADCADRLGVDLPSPLRFFYLAVGHCTPLLNGHHRVRPLGDLDLFDGRVIFADENQDSVSWAVDTEVGADGDCKVWQRVNVPTIEWHLEPARFGGFVEELLVFSIS